MFATAMPLLVKRTSGSSTRLPTMVVWLSAAIFMCSFLVLLSVRVRPALGPGGCGWIGCGRFRPSEQARTWRRGAQGERHTARLLDRLTGDGYVVFHDLAVPGNTSANVDHLVIGPTGVFVIDSKQWTGSVQQGADGLVWHNHYRLDRTLETVRWEAETLGRLLGTRGGGLRAQGGAIVPAHLLRSALGYDRVLSDADVELLASTAWTSLRPAA